MASNCPPFILETVLSEIYWLHFNLNFSVVVERCEKSGVIRPGIICYKSWLMRSGYELNFIKTDVKY